MKLKLSLYSLLFAIVLTLPIFSYAGSECCDITTDLCPCTVADLYPMSLLFYRGTLVETSLLNVWSPSSKTGPNIYSAEFAWQLSRTNLIRHFFQPWMTTISFNNNVSYINDPAGPIYEYDTFLMYRWENLPWNRFVFTTFGIGWGVSYDSRVSTWEKHDSDNTKKVLDFLAFETSFALPQYPRLQLVLRLHHRSGAFGLYGADNAGSNFIGAGIRYLF